MERTVMAFPVKPGATAEQVDSVSAMFRSRPEEYRESRRRTGVSLERAYHQPTPMGDFVVVYLETEGSAAEAMGKGAASELSIDQDFVRLVNEVHGIDVTAPTAGPPPETVGVWTDPDATARGRGLAFCAPLMPGVEDAGRAFAREAFETRRDEMSASRRAFDETVEVVTLQATPHGSIICVYLEGADPAGSNRSFAASDAPFDVWFKGQLATLFPPQIDFNQPIPPVQELFDSETMPAGA
ncbi:MAG: DUF6176 family protein [Actinomycetota bacterium]